MRNDERRVTKEVYYRCIWLVRDIERLIILSRFGSNPVLSSCENAAAFPWLINNGAECRGYDEDIMISSGKLVSDAAIERACIELECVCEALKTVPDVYRKEIIDNIVNKTPFSDTAHPNTWKKWKKAFIYQLAGNLDII